MPLDIILSLLTQGANPDKKDMDGDTALLRAIQNFRPYITFDIVKILLQYHANPFIKNNSNDTAWDLLSQSLLRWGRDWTPEHRAIAEETLRLLPSPIFQAIYDGNLDKIRK